MFTVDFDEDMTALSGTLIKVGHMYIRYFYKIIFFYTI